MSRILFATYEFHPTTWGGCGVLLRHATDLLLRQGHEVLLLLDVPAPYFERFERRDRQTLAVPDRCRAYHADALCEDFPWSASEVGNPFLWKSLRFAHAVRRLAEVDPADFVEFFEYCGVGHHALVEKQFGRQPTEPVLGIRVHNSVELIDLHEGTKPVDRDRSILYGLERAALARAEAVLLPSRSYADAYYVERYGLSAEATLISEPPTAPFPGRAALPEEERREIQFFGRIFEFKGVERFVRGALLVLEERPDLDLDFVLIGNDSHDGPGGSSYTEYLRSTIPTRFRDRFVFTGHLDHSALVERFGRARFAVFPNRFESFCYAAHEAFEAGVPMLVSDIPAFRNYFEEGRHAHYFDGSSVDVARQMSRLIDDPKALEALEAGRRLATRPLGDFYASPRALRPIGAASDRIDLSVLLLVPARATDAQVHRTLDAVRPQLTSHDRLVLAYDVEDGRAADGATAVRWLGATRCFQGVDGRTLPLASLATQDAFWMLLAGDEPAADFVALCRGALSRNPQMGFAGTWQRDAEGRLIEGTLDVVPERYPFERGGRPTRCLIRTTPSQLFVELFESQAGIYGEVGALWRAEDEWGPGGLLPEVKLVTSAVEREERDAGQLAFLVQAVASKDRRERLSLHALSEATSSGQPAPSPGTGMDAVRAQRIAQEYLDGTTLARMAWRKLVRKLGAATRTGPGPGSRGTG